MWLTDGAVLQLHGCVVISTSWPAMEGCEVEDSEKRWFETKRSLHNAKVPYFLRTISEKHIRRPALSNDVRTFEMVVNLQVWWMAQLFLTFLHDDVKVRLPFLDSFYTMNFFLFGSALFWLILICVMCPGHPCSVCAWPWWTDEAIRHHWSSWR